MGLGVARSTRVAIFVERSSDMIVGLLGVLKAGGTYVPIDPVIPPDRLGFLLRDSGAAIVLAHRSLVGRLPESQAARVVLLGRVGLGRRISQGRAS